jgi:hypothetical protein
VYFRFDDDMWRSELYILLLLLFLLLLGLFLL